MPGYFYSFLPEHELNSLPSDLRFAVYSETGAANGRHKGHVTFDRMQDAFDARYATTAALAELGEDVAGAVDAVADLTALVSGYESRISALETATGALISGVSTHETRLDGLDSQILSLLLADTALSDRLDAVEGDVSTLQTGLGAVQGDVSGLAGDVSTLQGDVSSLQGDITTLQGAVTTLESEMGAAQTDILALQGDVATLESELDDAEADISSLQGSVSAAEADISALQSDYSALSSTVAGLVSSVSTLDTRVDGHDTEIAAHETRLDDHDTDIADLTADLAALDLATLVALAPAASSRNLIVAANATTRPLGLKGAASQSAHLLTMFEDDNDVLATFDEAGRLAIGASDPGTSLLYVQGSSELFEVVAGGYARSNRFDVYNSANIDISLLSSGAKLKSGGTVGWSSTGAASGTADIGLARDAAGRLRITDGSTGTGDLEFEHGRAGNGLVGTPGLTFDSDTDLGFYRVSSDVLGVSCGGAQVAQFGGTYSLAVTGGTRMNGRVVRDYGTINSFVAGSTINDYTPASDLGAYYVTGWATSPVTLTGWLAGVNGQEIILILTTSGGGTLVFNRNDAGSATANQFTMNTASMTVASGEIVYMMYAVGKWRVSKMTPT